MLFLGNTNDNTATPIGILSPQTPITLLGIINDFEPHDLYSLTVNTPLTSGIALQGLTDNLNVAVLDNNGNLIASGNNLGTSNEAFQAFFPTAGQYFINVFQNSPGITSNYELALFPADVNVNTTNNSNDNPNTPTFLGTLAPEIPISQSAIINNLDPIDNYRVIAEEPLIVGVALEKSNINIEIAVLDSNRNLIARGDNSNLLNDAFTVPLSIPGDYNITVFQSEIVSDGSFSDYNLALFPNTTNLDVISPTFPQSPIPPASKPASVSIDSLIDGTDEVVRNRENTAFVFKEDYLLNATPNTPITIDLISNNNGLDPLLEVYQIPKDPPLEPQRRQIPIAANDNGGNNIDARIGPGVEPDILGISSELTLLPEFNYLLRATYTPELPLIGSFTLSVSVDNGPVSLQKVLFGNLVGEPMMGVE
ncbi:MAG: hypothetical protein MGF17_16015 [Trichodesmium sp. MAG_R04]|nr:hypothetical protein [Trichodesmium sp. MAG_R04]